MERSGGIVTVPLKRKRSSFGRALSNFGHNFLEYLLVFLNELGKYFSVERDVIFFDRVDEFAVGKILCAEGFTDRSLPTLAKCSFLGFSITERVFPRMTQRVFGESSFRLSPPTETPCLSQETFSFFVCGCSSFYA